ncbi:hypothetical protein ACPPVT_02485 [Angustibacter sp. McL0619]
MITVENLTKTHDHAMVVVVVVVDTNLTCASWAALADDKDVA